MLYWGRYLKADMSLLSLSISVRFFEVVLLRSMKANNVIEFLDATFARLLSIGAQK